MNEISNELSVGVFLLEFAVAIMLSVALSAIWREWMRRIADARDTSYRLLDQYERAWLQSGRNIAIERAVLNLLRKGNLVLDPNDTQRVHLQDFEDATHPMEVDVLDAVARYGTLQIKQVPHAAVTVATPYTLAQAGLIPQPGKRWLSIVPALFVVPAILLVGGLEAWELVGARKPAAMVVLLTVAGAFAVARLCLPARRTRHGDAVLKRLIETAPTRNAASTKLAVRLDNRPRQVA